MINIQNINQTKFNFDSARGSEDFYLRRLLLSQKKAANKCSPVLFSKGKRITNFFTEDSKLYITPKEMRMMSSGIKLDRKTKKWDSLSDRVVRNYQSRRSARKIGAMTKDLLLDKFIEYRSKIRKDIEDKSRSFWNQWSLQEVWNFSLIGAILLGMISMTLIYRLLGPGASAGNVAQNQEVTSELIAETPNVALVPEVLGMATEREEDNIEVASKNIEDIVTRLETAKKDEFEKEIRKMVKGYPIEKMIPEITQKDRIVAAFLVSIAKKESNWGKRVPVLNGQDCYNYWGYRGQRKLMGTGGHTCFNSRKDAVDTVAKRLETLIEKHKLDTPDKIVIWKCGSACHKDNPEAVRKWISDVHMYFDKLNK